MGRKYNTDWVIPVLKDLEDFLSANDMRESSRIVAEAAARVRMERNAFRTPHRQGTSIPGFADRGNVIHFPRSASRS